MNKRSIEDVQFSGQSVLMRVDFNVPFSDGKISDDSRIRAALPSIQKVVDNGGKLILASHLGRPKGKKSPELSLSPIAEHLGSLLSNTVKMAPDVIGDEVNSMAQSLQPGEILLLENTRFYPEEEGKGCSKEEQEAFARKLASLADIYVNDAFGTAHREHASTAVVCRFMETNVAGYLMQKELDFLGDAVENPERPFIAVIGGAKVSGKLEVLQNLISKVDALLIGGGMAYTFLKAQGHSVGSSLIENDLVDTAGDTMKQAENNGVKFMLPSDHVVGDNFAEEAQTQTVGMEIPEGWMGLDIGPQTVQTYAQEISKAKTIVWNGPMGCFEMAPFAKGTMDICRAIADTSATSIIGGGDSVSAVGQSGVADKMSHISTGGGASLEFLEGKELPGVAALDPK